MLSWLVYCLLPHLGLPPLWSTPLTYNTILCLWPHSNLDDLVNLAYSVLNQTDHFITGTSCLNTKVLSVWKKLLRSYWKWISGKSISGRFQIRLLLYHFYFTHEWISLQLVPLGILISFSRDVCKYWFYFISSILPFPGRVNSIFLFNFNDYVSLYSLGKSIQITAGAFQIFDFKFFFLYKF